MSLAEDLETLAGDFVDPSITDLLASLQQWAELPAPGGAGMTRSTGDPSMPLSAAEIMANQGAGIAAQTGVELADDSITGDHIIAGSITTGHLEAGVVVTNVLNVSETVLIDDDGITISGGALIFIDDYGATVLTGAGFGGGWLDFLAHRVYNGAFRAAPPTPGSDITTGAGSANQLPNYVFTQESGTKVTARWIADTGIGSGGLLKLSIAGSGASTDSAYIESIWPVSTNRAQDVIPIPIFSVWCPSSIIGTAGDVYISADWEFLQADASTSTGVAGGLSGPIFSDVNGAPGNAVTYELSNSWQPPVDAGYLRLRIRVARSDGFTPAANSAAGAIYVTNLRQVTYDTFLGIADTDPTLDHARIYKADGMLHLRAEVQYSPEIQMDEPTGNIFLYGQGGTDNDIHIVGRGDTGLDDGDVYLEPATYVRIPYGTLVHSSSISPASLGGAGTTNNYNPTDGHAAYAWYLSSTGTRNLTGIDAGVNGERHLLVNTNAVGSGDDVDVVPSDTGSTAANRFAGAADATIPVRPRGAIEIMYSGSLTRWLILNNW